MKQSKAKHILVGSMGESIACTFLMKQGFLVVERNFRAKCGEIDIIARKDGHLYFFEVKTISRETKTAVIHETYRPQENLHRSKIGKMTKTVQVYCLKRHVSHETPTHLDGLTVILDMTTRRARVERIENINIF